MNNQKNDSSAIENARKLINGPKSAFADFELNFVKENLLFRSTLGQKKSVLYRTNILMGDNRGSSGEVTCSAIHTTMLTGEDFTDSEGNRAINIDEKMCSPLNEISNVIFVATVNATKPVILNFTLTNENKVVNVKTFDQNGDPIGNIRFHWHITFGYYIQID